MRLVPLLLVSCTTLVVWYIAIYSLWVTYILSAKIFMSMYFHMIITTKEKYISGFSEGWVELMDRQRCDFIIKIKKGRAVPKLWASIVRLKSIQNLSMISVIHVN